jgi:hypothetical protein
MLKLPEYIPEAGKVVSPTVVTGLPVKVMLLGLPEKAEADTLLNLNKGVEVAE